MNRNRRSLFFCRLALARQIHRFAARCRVKTVAAHYIPVPINAAVLFFSPLPLCVPSCPRVEANVSASHFAVACITRFYCKGLAAVCGFLSACPSAVRCDRCLVRGDPVAASNGAAGIPSAALNLKARPRDAPPRARARALAVCICFCLCRA